MTIPNIPVTVEERAAMRRRVGLIVMLTSAAVFSTAGLFTKGVSASAWSVIFWRGIFAALFTTIYVARRGAINEEFIKMGRPGLLVALLGAFGTAAFIPAFKLTSIANVSLIYATAPFCAAGVAWLWFREQPERRIMIATCVALLGVGLIVAESFGELHLRGDVLALWMTLMMSSVMVVYRRYPNTPTGGPAALSSIVLLPIALYFGDPFTAPIFEIGIMAAFGLIFAVASVALSEGARRLPPAEAALISAMEVPLAIVWAWAFFAEQPSVLVAIGGVIILASVFGSQVASIMFDRKKPNPY